MMTKAADRIYGLAVGTLPANAGRLCGLFFLALLWCLPAPAQVKVEKENVARVNGTSATDSLSDGNRADILATETDRDGRGYILPVSPSLMEHPGMPSFSPFSFSPYYGADWRLHEGFNAQLELSLAAGIGHHRPKGVGFGQNAAFAYALPLSERFSVAAGIYATHWDWGGRSYTDGGVAASFCYRLTDRINLYAYGAQSFVPSSHKDGFGSPFWPYGNPKNRFGAMAEFKIGENASIQVSVERQTYSHDLPARLPEGNRRMNNPR